MKKQYKQLSDEERDEIVLFRAKGFKIREIARRFKRNPSTLSRELKHNKSPTYDVYLAHRAQQRAYNANIYQYSENGYAINAYNAIS